LLPCSIVPLPNPIQTVTSVGRLGCFLHRSQIEVSLKPRFFKIIRYSDQRYFLASASL
jgi:hypothetical protein